MRYADGHIDFASFLRFPFSLSVRRASREARFAEELVSGSRFPVLEGEAGKPARIQILWDWPGSNNGFRTESLMETGESNLWAYRNPYSKQGVGTIPWKGGTLCYRNI